MTRQPSAAQSAAMCTGMTSSVWPEIWMWFQSTTTVRLPSCSLTASRRASATCPFCCSPSVIATNVCQSAPVSRAPSASPTPAESPWPRLPLDHSMPGHRALDVALEDAAGLAEVRDELLGGEEAGLGERRVDAGRRVAVADRRCGRGRPSAVRPGAGRRSEYSSVYISIDDIEPPGCPDAASVVAVRTWPRDCVRRSASSASCLGGERCGEAAIWTCGTPLIEACDTARGGAVTGTLMVPSVTRVIPEEARSRARRCSRPRKAAALAGGRVLERSRERHGRRAHRRARRTDFVTEADVASGVAVVRGDRRARSPARASSSRRTRSTTCSARTRASLDDGEVWVIDPLDGTTSFVHGYPTYSVSVALRARRRSRSPARSTTRRSAR